MEEENQKNEVVVPVDPVVERIKEFREEQAKNIWIWECKGCKVVYDKRKTNFVEPIRKRDANFCPKCAPHY